MKIILSRRSYRLPQRFSHADRHFRSLRVKAARWKYTEVDVEFFLQEFFPGRKSSKMFFNLLRNKHDLSNPCSSRTDDFLFSSFLPYQTLSSERRCLGEVSVEMQSHLFLSSYYNLSLLSFPRKITFSSDLHFCRMVVTDERLQARRLLIFFPEFS